MKTPLDCSLSTKNQYFKSKLLWHDELIIRHLFTATIPRSILRTDKGIISTYPFKEMASMKLETLRNINGRTSFET